MNHRKNNQVQGAIPCGNPKRFGSRDVVCMPDFGSKTKKWKGNETADMETEADRHIQFLLQRQTKKDVTLADQYSQHREFTPATSHAPEIEKLEGVHGYKEYIQVDELDSKIDLLRHCGLDDEEITLKLKEELKDKVPITFGGYGIDPLAKKKKLEDIERKIQEKAISLQVQDKFKGALELSRQAMDLEKSMAARHGKDLPLASVVTTRQRFEGTHPDDPINHIPEILDGLEKKKERESRRDRRKKRKLERRKQHYAEFAEVDKDNDECNDNTATSDKSVLHKDHTATSLHQTSPYVHSPQIFNSSQVYSLDGSSSQLRDQHAVFPIFSKDVAKTIADGEELHPLCFQELLCESRNKNTHSNTTETELKNSQSKSSICTEANILAKTIKEISTPIHLLSREDILKNRLSIDEIRKLDKFHNYTEGVSSKTVYVKNLPNKITEEELVALFGQFQSADKEKIVFKLLSGRMKGQAFITFPDECTATEAVHLINGYKLRDRPVIVSFSRKGHE